MTNTFQRWLKTAITAVLLVALSIGLSAAWWDTSGSSNARDSRLPEGNAITDGRALLRYALPINNDAVRDLQASLEDIATQLRARRRWSGASSDLSDAKRILTIRRSELLDSIQEENKAAADALISQLEDGFTSLADAIAAEDKEQTLAVRNKLLDFVGDLESLMIAEFPYEIPSEYSYLPQLKGRATVEMKTTKGNITLILDGYSAPVTAGNFVDLVNRGFYDGLPFTRAEEFYVVQAGDPPGKEVGFIDPKTGKYRNIPLEILARGDEVPTYGITFEAAGRYRDQPVLPFSAYGTIAMARPEEEPNGASSQFFFFLFEPELTPAGLNLLDGRYTVFGYVGEGQEVLRELRQGDVIESAKVIQGGENLVPPQTS